MSKISQGDCDMSPGLNRRELLQRGALGLGSFALGERERFAHAAEPHTQDRSIILLLMVGGPSQLETWDPKPDAPAEIRGPHRSIATRIPGVRINEHLPRLAQRMDRLALIRSVHHNSAPIHETGQQLLQTGRLSTDGKEHPSIGAYASRLLGRRGSMPASVVLPGPIGNTGVMIPHGQAEGWLQSSHRPFTPHDDPGSPSFNPKAALSLAGRSLGDEFAKPNRSNFKLDRESRISGSRNPFDLSLETDRVRQAYGDHTFGQSCLLARRLVEAGVRVVTVNMYQTVFNQVSWDCHGSQPFSTLEDYATEVLPQFDQAFSALLDDLHRSGRLRNTMVLASGEFGRSPKLNAAGGRDHWPDVWSVAIAGGGIRGGQVLGASDASASEPSDRPVTPPELFATLLSGLNLDPYRAAMLDDRGEEAIVEEARPIDELFG